MNFIHYQCNSCGETGFISKQITDGYQPFCYRCGEQDTKEIEEVSLIRK
jgi:predicted nucleic acid-binding Zn ribbon protein